MLATKKNIKSKIDAANHHEKKLHDISSDVGRIYFTNSVKDTMTYNSGKTKGGSRATIYVSKVTEKLLEYPDITERLYIDRLKFKKAVVVFWDLISFGSLVVKGTKDNGFKDAVIRDVNLLKLLEDICGDIVKAKYSSFLDYQVVCAKELSLYTEDKIRPKENIIKEDDTSQTVQSLRSENLKLLDENKILKASARSLEMERDSLLERVKSLEDMLANSKTIQPVVKGIVEVEEDKKEIEEEVNDIKIEQVSLADEYEDFEDDDEDFEDDDEDEDIDSY